VVHVAIHQIEDDATRSLALSTSL